MTARGRQPLRYQSSDASSGDAVACSDSRSRRLPRRVAGERGRFERDPGDVRSSAPSRAPSAIRSSSRETCRARSIRRAGAASTPVVRSCLIAAGARSRHCARLDPSSGWPVISKKVQRWRAASRWGRGEALDRGVGATIGQGWHSAPVLPDESKTFATKIHV